MEYQNIIFEKNYKIATIFLNRPHKRNAFNNRLLEEFVDAREKAATDPDIKVLIITGSGSAFCSGYDFSESQTSEDDLPESMIMRNAIAFQEKQMLELKKVPKPVIAMINGPVIGAGMGFFLHCDLSIASANATFGFKFVNLGLHPEVGLTYILPRLVGNAKACELLFLGKTIDAKEAEKLGLVNLVVTKNKLADTTMEYAIKLAEGPSIAIGLMKISLYHSWMDEISSALESEARANAICRTTDDYKEAIAAFRQKRSPNFKGK
jgi:2-(1,2-epoxy-1,2-dihydrophenyl)acetyl-CoA isomerase